MKKFFLVLAALSTATLLAAMIFQNMEHTRTLELIAAGLAGSALVVWMVDKFIRNK